MSEIIEEFTKIKLLITNLFQEKIDQNKNNFVNNLEKEFINNTFEYFNQIIELLKKIDSTQILKWKNNNLNLFLHFVVNLKTLLLTILNYLELVKNDLRHEYTEEIVQEIEKLKENIQIIAEKLNSNDDEDFILEKKIGLEKEYSRLEKLLTLRNDLTDKHETLKNTDFEKLYLEISDLQENVLSLQSRLEPLIKEKKSLKKNIDNYKNISLELEDLKHDEEQNLLDLLDKIEDSLSYIRENHKNWDDKKEKISRQFEIEAENYKHTEQEIKKLLTKLSGYRDSFLKNKAVLEKHFETDKNIVGSIPNITNSISEKVGKIEKDLSELDSEISRFLRVTQRITDEISKNPLTFD